MLNRRELLTGAAALGATALLPPGCHRPHAGVAPVWVNDVHSGLNATPVSRIVRPESLSALQDTVRDAARRGERLGIAGGRHAMGGQQFARGSALIDTRGLARVLELDRHAGWVEAEAGIQWPELVAHLRAETAGGPAWSIVQKQTGADRLCLGGALAANAHGRGLTLAPLVGDVEAFTLVDANGTAHRCSRRENPELFRLAIGGYGLFGVVASVRLRLTPMRKLERTVELIESADLMTRFERRIAQGYLYGDFQYATDLGSENALRTGVFSCYRPVPDETRVPERQRSLEESDWRELIALAHLEPSRAFDEYARYYLGTSGQVYWSDLHQMSTYIDDYHEALAGRLGALARGSEMITEVYVPRDALAGFLEAARRELAASGARLIYGTIRLIEPDRESFLPWAREAWACVIFNLHVAHDRAGLASARRSFRRLIDLGLERDGSYFLTYHRWAERPQVEAAHPAFAEMLRAKRRLDPEERFTSEWYRHYSRVFSAG